MPCCIEEDHQDPKRGALCELYRLRQRRVAETEPYYAENARGKTILADVMRSLKLGQGDIVLGRRMLGSTAPTEIDIRLDASTAKFRAMGWDTTYPNLLVFDSTFVHQNIYAGDVVGHDHKRNLYQVLVGQSGVQLAMQIDCLDDKIRQITTSMGKNRTAIDRLVGIAMKPKEFLRLQPDRTHSGFKKVMLLLPKGRSVADGNAP